MKKILAICSAMMLAGWGMSVQAAVYFASPDGTGNGATMSTPCSFSQGIGKLSQPGDTLYLLSGQYDLNTTMIQNLHGTESARIVISGYEGINRSGTYPVILDFRSTPYGKRGLEIKGTCTYLHVKNMTLRYSGKNNLHNEGSYNLFENMDIYGSADTGCQMKGDAAGGDKGGHNIIKNIDSHDNFDYELDKSGTLTLCDFGGNADGFADKQFTGAGNHYIGCRAWNNSDDGWDFFQRVSTSQTVIENCICYANGPKKYDMTDHPRYATDRTWFEQFESGRYVTDKSGNSVYVTLAAYPNMGNGNGFKLGGDGTVHDVLVHHSLSVSNTVKGFDQNSNAGTVYLYNNTGYKNGSDYKFYNPNGCKLYIRNCIGFNTVAADLKDEIVQVSSHNSWNDGFAVSSMDFQSIDKSLVLAPRKSDGSLPENEFMRLKGSSALVDAGTDVGLPFNGIAPDLGCYETDGSEGGESSSQVFYWRLTSATTPKINTVLPAVGGTLFAGTKDNSKDFLVDDYTDYVSTVPDYMRATVSGKGLKMTANALYLTLRLNSGTFHKGDTLRICGYNVWRIATSPDMNDVLDSIMTGAAREAHDTASYILPANADSLVLQRNRGKGTGVTAILVTRDPALPTDLLESQNGTEPAESRKILRNGQLYIRRNERTYTITGQLITEN